MQKQSRQYLKEEQRKANTEGNKTWSLKMYDDEEIDFEQLLEDEERKQKEQEKKDAELAQKLLEDELRRQEEEQVSLAIKYSMIEEGKR